MSNEATEPDDEGFDLFPIAKLRDQAEKNFHRLRRMGKKLDGELAASELVDTVMSLQVEFMEATLHTLQAVQEWAVGVDGALDDLGEDEETDGEPEQSMLLADDAMLLKTAIVSLLGNLDPAGDPMIIEAVKQRADQAIALIDRSTDKGEPDAEEEPEDEEVAEDEDE